MALDPDSSVSVSGITDEELAALQRAGQTGAGLAPSIDEMKYATQVEPKTIMAGRGARVQPYEDIVTPAITEGLMPMLYGAGKGTISTLAGIPGDINDAFKWVRDQGSYSQAAGQGNDIPNTISNTLENLPAPKNTEQIYNSFNTTGKPTEDYGRMMGQNIVANLMFPQAPKAIRATKDLPIGLAIKNKGGNWIDSSLSAFDQFKKPIREESYLNQIRNDILDGVQQPESLQTALRGNAQNGAINNWIDSKLKKYVKNEMGTPTDPVRELADQGITHLPNIEGINPNYAPSMEDVKVQRAAANMPLQGFASSPLGKHWENLTDRAIRNRSAGMRVKQGESTTAFPQMKRALEENPWLKTVEPTTPVHDANGFVNDLEFRHLIDELKNSISHNSDLPAHLRLKPETLEKMTVPHAVKHVAKVNKYRAEKIAEAAKENLSQFPVVHEGGNGYNIHELKMPESEHAVEISKMPNGLYEVFEKDRSKSWKSPETGRVGFETPEAAQVAYNKDKNFDKLDRALKNEGEQMGHCVGGYTSSVANGESRIFSLRDDKGGAHATVEAIPNIRQTYNPKYIPDDVQAQIHKHAHDETIKAGYPENSMGYWNHYTGVQIQDGTKYLAEHPKINIRQIKGKGNGAVSDKYRTYIKDWLNKEADNIHRAEDLDHIGVTDLKNGLIRRENIDPKIIKALESGELKRFASDEEIKHIMTRPEVKEQSFNPIKNGIPTSLKKVAEDLANQARNEHPNANIEFATSHNGIVKGGDHSVPSSSLNLQPNGIALHTHGYDERDLPSISDFEEWVKHPIQKHYGIIKPHPDTGQIASHSSVIIEPKSGFEMPTQRQLMAIQKDIYKQNPELVNRLDKGDLDVAIWKHLLDQSASGKIDLHLHNVAYPYELKAGELVDKMTPMERGQYLDHLRNETQKALDKNPEAKKFVEMYQKGNARGLNHEEINNFLRYGNTNEIPWSKPAHILRKEYGIDAFDDFIKNEAPKLDRDLTLFRATDELARLRNSKTSGQHFGYLSTSINPDITNALLANESWNRLKGAKTTTHVVPKGSSIVAPNIHNDLEWQKEIILPRHNPVKKPEGFKKGGRVKMSEGGEPQKLTPAQMRDELFAKSRVNEAERKAAEPRTLEQRMIDQGRLPAKSGSGGSGGDGLLRNEISAKNPVYKKGGKIPSMDEMRLTILRNK